MGLREDLKVEIEPNKKEMREIESRKLREVPTSNEKMLEEINKRKSRNGDHEK